MLLLLPRVVTSSIVLLLQLLLSTVVSGFISATVDVFVFVDVVVVVASHLFKYAR